MAQSRYRQLLILRAVCYIVGWSLTLSAAAALVKATGDKPRRTKGG